MSRPWAQDNKPVSVSISPVTVLKIPFPISAIAFRKQEWFNVARDDFLRLLRTPLVGSFMVVEFQIVNELNTYAGKIYVMNDLYIICYIYRFQEIQHL
jgi:hypothetical protein